MSKEIIEVLDALSDKLGLSISWTQDNVLPYFQELSNKYVNYEIATSVMWVVVAVLLILGGIWFIKFGIGIGKKDDFEYEEVFLVCYVVGLCLVFAGIVVLFYQILDIITCYTFPEKVVIEKLISLKKQMGYR